MWFGSSKPDVEDKEGKKNLFLGQVTLRWTIFIKLIRSGHFRAIFHDLMQSCGLLAEDWPQ